MCDSKFYLLYCFNFISKKIKNMFKPNRNYYIYENNEWININFEIFMLKFTCNEYILPKNYLCEINDNFIFVYTTLNELPNIIFNYDEDIKFYKDNIKYKRIINNNVVEVKVSENDLNKFINLSNHEKANTNLHLILNQYYNYNIDYIEYNNNIIHINHLKLKDLIDETF